jgi:hypothetical protein
MVGNAVNEEVFTMVVWDSWTGLRECASMPHPTRKLNTLIMANQ